MGTGMKKIVKQKFLVTLDAFLVKELETCPSEKMASKNEVFKQMSLEQELVSIGVGGAAAFQPQALESLRVRNFMSRLGVQ